MRQPTKLVAQTGPLLGLPSYVTQLMILRVPHPCFPKGGLLRSSALHSLLLALKFLFSVLPPLPRLTAKNCHPDGDGPTFSYAPFCGASGLSPLCHPDRSNGAFCRCAVEGSRLAQSYPPTTHESKTIPHRRPTSKPHLARPFRCSTPHRRFTVATPPPTPLFFPAALSSRFNSSTLSLLYFFFLFFSSSANSAPLRYPLPFLKLFYSSTLILLQVLPPSRTRTRASKIRSRTSSFLFQKGFLKSIQGRELPHRHQPSLSSFLPPQGSTQNQHKRRHREQRRPRPSQQNRRSKPREQNRTTTGHNRPRHRSHQNHHPPRVRHYSHLTTVTLPAIPAHSYCIRPNQL